MPRNLLYFEPENAIFRAIVLNDTATTGLVCPDFLLRKVLASVAKLASKQPVSRP